jgi:hypothetical protein
MHILTASELPPFEALVDRLHPYSTDYLWGKMQEVHANDTRNHGTKGYLPHLVRVAYRAQIIAQQYFHLYARQPHVEGLPTGDLLSCDQHAIFLSIEQLALSHNAYEDHPAEFPLEEAAKHLSGSVLRGIPLISKPSRKGQAQLGWYSVYLRGIAADFITVIVKIADLEDNMSDLGPGKLRDKYEATYLFLKTQLDTVTF